METNASQTFIRHAEDLPPKKRTPYISWRLKLSQEVALLLHNYSYTDSISIIVNNIKSSIGWTNQLIPSLNLRYVGLNSSLHPSSIQREAPDA